MRLVYPILLVGLACAGCATQGVVVPSSAVVPVMEDGRTVRAEVTLTPHRKRRWMQADFARWEVVVFHPPGESEQLQALRVVGLPGEAISIENGAIVVDGQAVTAPDAVDVRYAAGAGVEGAKAVALPCSVPEDGYFLLSDSPQGSRDSRIWGPIRREQIVGKLLGVAADA